MLDDQPRLETLLNGGEVSRYHQWPMIRRQDVAQHTFNMLVIADTVYPIPETSNKAIAEDLAKGYILRRAILYHDVSEGRRGLSDVSAWCKWNHPDLTREYDVAEVSVNYAMGLPFLNDLSPAVQRRLKVCDTLELIWTLLSERRLGNRVLFGGAWSTLMNKLGRSPEEGEEWQGAPREIFQRWQREGNKLDAQE